MADIYDIWAKFFFEMSKLSGTLQTSIRLNDNIPETSANRFT